jgi:GT2 family glycosyltransferase
MAPASDNVKGFFEDLDVFRLNEQMLDELDIRWDFPTLIPDIDFSDHQFAVGIKQAAELLKERSDHQQTFAVKDPRLCILLPVWLEAARTAGFSTSLLVAVRNPLDVAKSIERRNNYTLDKGLSLWLSYNFRLLATLVDVAAEPLVVDYRNFLSNPYHELERIGRFLVGNRFNELTNGNAVKTFVSDFLDPELCHANSSEHDLLKWQGSSSTVARLYKCFSEFAVGAWSKRRAIEVTRSLPEPSALEAKFYRQQLGEFASEREQLSEELERLGAAKAELGHALQAKEKEIGELRNAHKHEMSALLAERERQIRLLTTRKDKEIDELRRAKDQEIAAANSLLAEARRNVEAGQRLINAIQKSMSLRVGRLITWPISKPYYLFLKPFVENPGNLRLAGYSLYYVLRHPLRSRQLISRGNMRKAYTIFFRQPQIARDVVGRVGVLLHGETPHFPLKGANQLSQSLSHHSLHGGRVSLFVINYNGGEHLPGLLASLASQDYKDYEVIVVDNGSTDGSVSYVRRHFPEVKLLELEENVGFSEGNNIAAEVATGRYYCLVNNDAEVDPKWLSSLVGCIEKSDTIGAVGSKILFWKRFARVTIEIGSYEGGPGGVKLDVERLIESATVYPKLFFGSGLVEDQMLRAPRCRAVEKWGEFYFPVCAGQTLLRLRLFFPSCARASVRTSVDSVGKQVKIDEPGWHEIELDFSSSLDKEGLGWLINNAGSHVSENGDVRDRGFGLPDDGMYDDEEDVTALCGGAMLIRPEALEGGPVFGGKFFAYYEDTELSLRLRAAGYRLVYCPESRLFHKHASTSGEDTPLFKYYVSRNRILFLALHYPEQLWRTELANARLKLNHLRVLYESKSTDPAEKEFAASIPKLLAEWERLIPEVETRKFLNRKRYFPKIGVFNNFWNTLGGGENHACVIAHALQRFGPVDLVSETDFSIEDLERQFGIDLKYCRKVIASAPELHHNAAMTGQYDVFVNSTFCSDLPSHARCSYYVVSFPFRLSKTTKMASFLETYQFLANSAYTQEWVKRWWGVEAKVLYPAVVTPSIEFQDIQKTRIVLHVGRFFRVGHNKKQLELVRVFKKLVDAGTIPSDWRFVLAGQVRDIDVEYFDTVRNEARGYPIEVTANQPVELLHRLYRDAAIYWHATGLGEPTAKRPELAEHFGISTVEAMSFGCVPVVINQGGQRETVQDGVTGFRFGNEQELAECTLRVMEMFENDHERFKAISARAYQYGREFSREKTEEKLLALLESDGFRRHRAYRLS